ncbi:uncharacterized protein LOC143197405 [Rhynchophorus ferrugineus]|uniref:Uncharacterized protein n=1 Tax=Rhynchophorus ferrugineus TaxID=354439 RepID=A0A834ICZ2_RHYFE|nr:hypothetical protein GWI33_015575 [Rhynchophorus ferrugineus]
MENCKNIKSMNLTELRKSLDRINSLLNKSNIINKLTDKGAQLRKAKENLEREIAFREDLNVTNNLMSALSISSEEPPSHLAKMCMIEKTIQTQRFKPNVGVKPTMEPKVQMIDLKTSLDLQKQQEDRVKAELMSNLVGKNTEEKADLESDEEDESPELNPNLRDNYIEHVNLESDDVLSDAPEQVTTEDLIRIRKTC